MNLETTYLGLRLKNPLVPSASPLCQNVDSMKRLEDAGAAAVVLGSLFEEQIIHDTESLTHYLDYGAESFSEALSYLPEPKSFANGPTEYLDLVRRAKSSLSIPVIASLNGVSPAGWTRYARLIQDAGADALELNIYLIPTNPDESGAAVEERYLEIVRAVRAEVQIPLAVKVGPYFSNMANMAARFQQAGAQGLVLFNRFYLPDFDLVNLEVEPRLVLSRSPEMRLPLHWIALLYGKVELDLALTTGVHSHYDVLKAMMAGGKVAMLASELLQKGPGRIAEIIAGLQGWMQEYEYQSIEQMRGSMSQRNVPDPTAFERANYVRELASYRPDPSGTQRR